MPPTMPHSEPLRTSLLGAINQREASLRNGRCQRTDHHQIWVSISRAQSFLSQYPVADDTMVREWCRTHVHDLARIVPGNARGTIAKLLIEELAELSHPTSKRA